MGNFSFGLVVGWFLVFLGLRRCAIFGFVVGKIVWGSDGSVVWVVSFSLGRFLFRVILSLGGRDVRVERYL